LIATILQSGDDDGLHLRVDCVRLLQAARVSKILTEIFNAASAAWFGALIRCAGSYGCFHDNENTYISLMIASHVISMVWYVGEWDEN
jgi:hypothetical protein